MARRIKAGLQATAIVAAVIELGFACSVPLLRAQSLTTDWEKAAGGKIPFDVVSVKLNTTGHYVRPNFPFDNSNAYAATGGLLSVTNFPLQAYISFAYKLTSAQQQLFLAPQLPKWASADRFDIEGRAADTNPTKDQMRLMMQSLLADRFNMVVHWETKEMTVYALTIAPGGFKLKPIDPNGPPAKFSMACPPDDVGCRMMFMPSVQVADFVGNLGGMAGRPVIDETGITGTYNMNIEWAGDTSPNPSLPSLPAALRDNFGLELKSAKAPVDVLIIDHIEEPTPN